MKATWARAMAAKINTKGSQYGEITQQIREAVEEGKYEMLKLISAAMKIQHE